MGTATRICRLLMAPFEWAIGRPLVGGRADSVGERKKTDRPQRDAADSPVVAAFEAAVEAVRTTGGDLPPATRLRLYGLYKQATVGDAPAAPPGAALLNPTAHAKHHGWAKLRGTPEDFAMKAYVQLANGGDGDADEAGGGGLPPGVSEDELLDAMTGGMAGPVMSCMAADSDEEASDDGLALHAAARHGEPQLCASLLDGGEELEAVDEDGHTALHLACDRGHVAVVACLLERGAALGARNSDGSTPLHMACACEHEAIAAMLLRAGAPADALDEDGCTPAQLAPAALVGALRAQALLGPG